MSVGMANRAELVPANQETITNEFARPAANSATEIQSNRAMQEVRAAYVMAKQFPRNESLAFENIMKACKRRRLAECAEYEYPRGGERITGPSIRLAEVLAQQWGNIDSGFVETEQRAGWSTVMAYAVDYQTGARSTKGFQVEHVRATKQGRRALTDPRDIYELVANQAMRRVRACVLALIPGDLVEAAAQQCRKTLASNDTPIDQRVKSMISAFIDFQVTVPMIEAYLGMPISAISENQLARMIRIGQSLRDGITTREEVFDVNAGAPPAAASGGDEADDANQSKASALGKKLAASKGAAKERQPGEEG